MDSFVAEGLSDTSLSSTNKTLPEAVESVTARSRLIELQHLVLTPERIDLESKNDHHSYFENDPAHL